MKTIGNELIQIICANCNFKITNWKNIFEGVETSYICPNPLCRYEGYANKFNTEIEK